MSKAFTKEDVEVPEVTLRRRGVPVPALNLVTADGLIALRAELETLTSSLGTQPDTTRAAARIRELADHLATAQTIEPEDAARVGLGAYVTVEDTRGERMTYRVVGAIEADPKRGWISWQSPLAQVLWGAELGDQVALPRGDGEIIALGWSAPSR
jgi:transcription elongation GreA/GreB family factor